MRFVYPKQRHLYQLSNNEAVSILQLIEGLDDVDVITDVIYENMGDDYEIHELWNPVFIKAIECQTIADTLDNGFERFINKLSIGKNYS